MRCAEGAEAGFQVTDRLSTSDTERVSHEEPYYSRINAILHFQRYIEE